MSVTELFIANSTLTEHFEKQGTQRDEYIATYLALRFKYRIEFTLHKQARILAAAMIRSDTEFVRFLLGECEYSLPVVLKTCQILDSRRLQAQLTRKTDRIKNRRKLAAHKSVISNLETLHEGLEVALTKSKSKLIVDAWLRRLTPQQLELMALQFPRENWQKLTNLLHTRDDDFQVDWFNCWIWNKDLPDNVVIKRFANATVETIGELVQEYQPPYSYLKCNHPSLLSPAVLQQIAGYASTNTILKHWSTFEPYQELVCDRLRKGDCDLTYGAVMRELLNMDPTKPVTVELKKVAAERLRMYEIDLEKPVTVFGDASSSMNVAIRTSGIITSILVSLFGAELHLFRGINETIDNPPSTVEQVLEMGRNIEANGSTAPAACIKPYLDQKKVCKTFIVVTDEEENTDASGSWHGDHDQWFAPLFKRYSEEVYPARLVFISFLSSRRDGHMVKALKQTIPDITERLTVFVMNGHSPDLRKIDDILNQLTLNTDQFREQVSKLVGLPPQQARDVLRTPPTTPKADCTVM